VVLFCGCVRVMFVAGGARGLVGTVE